MPSDPPDPADPHLLPLGDLDVALQAPLDELRDAAGGRRSSLFLRDPATGELVTRVAHLPEIEEIRLPPDTGIAGAVLACGQPLGWPGSAPSPSRHVAEVTGYHPETILAVPVRLENRVVGVLQLMDAAQTARVRHLAVRTAGRLERLLARSSLAAQLVPLGQRPASLAYHIEGFVGASDEMLRVIRLTRRLARVDTPVLVSGEAGAGKELLARTLHANSDRASAPFCKVDCASLSDVHLAAELFGYAADAFPGSGHAVPGQVQRANGGTLFLEEVGALSTWIGNLLQRLFVEDVIIPLGGRDPIPVDVRIVASSSRDLDDRAEADFLRYLEGCPIRLPPLRERGRDDTLRLLDHFVALYSHRYGRTIHDIPVETQERAVAYHWPGNVGELSRTVEAAVLRASEGILSPDLLDIDPKPSQGPFESYPTRDELVDAYIRFLMEKKQGRRNEVAGILDVSRTTLWRRLKVLGYD